MNTQAHIDAREPYKTSYVWDGIEKRGFPVSEHVKILDLDELTPEERLVVAEGNSLEIEKIVTLKGDEFLNVMSQNMELFLNLMFSLYQHESDKKKLEILNVIRSTYPGYKD